MKTKKDSLTAGGFAHPEISQEPILIQHRTEPRIDSRLFAKRAGLQHRSLYKLIKNNIKQLREFGSLPSFEIAAVNIAANAYQVNDSLLAGDESLTQSAKLYANQPTVGGWDNSDNLKRGEFTPFDKGDFSHLSKEANYPHWQDLCVTNSYSQKKKDSVQAVLVQRHSLEQTSRLPNSIGLPQRLPDYIGLVQYFLSSIGGWDLNRINNIYSVQHHSLVNDVHSVDCLALRFSDLSFFSQASITHAEKLEFSLSVIKLISSINSSGNRIPLYCDLLFLCPVAISKLQSKCFNTRKNTIKIFSKEVFKQKHLDVFKQFDVTYLNTLIIYIKKKQNPIGAENTYRASDHNVKRGNTMAMYKSTQTHPKFLWRFFSCQQFKYFSVEATNEQEARSMLPDSPCLFSARIRQGGVIMDKSIALFNVEYKSQQASTLFEVIFEHVCKQENVDQYLLDLIGIVCDLNEQINRCAVSALEVANA